MVLVASIALGITIGLNIVHARPIHRARMLKAEYHAGRVRYWSYILALEKRDPKHVGAWWQEWPSTWDRNGNGLDGVDPRVTRVVSVMTSGDCANAPVFHTKLMPAEEARAWCRTIRDYHEQMRRKWAWGAWTPSRPVAPDPFRPPVRVEDFGGPCSF